MERQTRGAGQRVPGRHPHNLLTPSKSDPAPRAHVEQGLQVLALLGWTAHELPHCSLPLSSAPRVHPHAHGMLRGQPCRAVLLPRVLAMAAAVTSVSDRSAWRAKGLLAWFSDRAVMFSPSLRVCANSGV